MSIDTFLKQDMKDDKVKIKVFRHITFWVLLGVMVYSVGTLCSWALDNFKTYQINKKLAKSVNLVSSNEDGEFVNPPSDKNSNFY